ncbi:ABC transporter permease [Candidatus Bipolaricaulota bacterium]|nr:ABC transporter permease [Candidatus Bipolaricaulota bacterium]
MKKKYIIRKLLTAIPTFLIATIILFSLLHIAPSGPVEIMVRSSGKTMDPGMIEELRSQYGLDKPLHQQYFRWLSNFFTGDLGYSYVTNQRLNSILPEKILLTLELVLVANVFSVAFAVVLGVIAAVRKNSFLDNFLSSFALFTYSMPLFWVGLLALYVFSLKLGLTPVGGVTSLGKDFTGFAAIADNLYHLILPASVLSLAYLAYYFRLIRSSMLDVLNKEYVVAARAKGVKELAVIFKHALRNALLPLITLFAVSLGFVLAGSVVIETIFGWPGLGRFLVTAAFNRDYTALLSLNAIIVIMVLFANLVADIACAYVDPRIKY